VKRHRVFWSSGGMGFDHLEDEEIVLIHERIVEQATFEARMALGNKRRLDQMSLLGCQAKLAELVDVRTGRVADPSQRCPSDLSWAD